MSHDSRVLVTGATGYVGGRLVPRLLAAGYRVRLLVRDAGKLDSRPWRTNPRVEIVEGDVADPAALRRAMHACRIAYYLVHSMIAAGRDYRERDRRLASGFAAEAERAGLARIVYLGGLGETGSGLSEHLASRREVEAALAGGRVPVTVLRAAMIIGSGSASFEILRYLVERLPVMVTPRWVETPCQPIAIENALHALVQCIEVPETEGRTIDIGGPDIMTYRELMRIMAECLGLRRRIVVPVPVLTPKLSALWIHLITPVGHRIARPLAEGLRNPVVCRDDAAQRLMPQRLLTAREAIGTAVGAAELETSWLDAGPLPGDPDWAGGTVYRDERCVRVTASAHAAFAAACRVGGTHGWHSAAILWRIRGAMDRLVGGPGLSRGRRDVERLAYGDALDFWRVTELVQDHRLGLRAEMRLPGEALLSFEVTPGDTPETSTLRQFACFKPRGLGGLLYWYAVKPFHRIVFRDMIEGIRREAEASLS